MDLVFESKQTEESVIRINNTTLNVKKRDSIDDSYLLLKSRCIVDILSHYWGGHLLLNYFNINQFTEGDDQLSTLVLNSFCRELILTVIVF